MRPNLCLNGYGFQMNPTVLLLAGAYTNSAMWPISFIHNLVDNGLYVLTMDYRDCGKNMWNKRPFTMDDIIDDIHHTLSINREFSPHLMGASMGGSVAMRYALKYDCKSLVLYATTPGLPLSDPMLSPPTSETIKFLQSEYELIKCGKIRQALQNRYKYFGNEKDSHVREIVNSIIKRGLRSDCYHGNAFVSSNSIVEELKHIENPTLILHGEHDDLFPIDHAWKMHHELENSKLHILPETNHHFINSDYISTIISNHINKNS